MPTAVTIATPINELDSCEIACSQLTKEDGTILTPAALQTLTLTLTDVATNTVINTLDHADILNAGRGTLDSNGRLLISLEKLDSPIVTSATQIETHRALIEGTWNLGKGRTSQEVFFYVKNLIRVP